MLILTLALVFMLAIAMLCAIRLARPSVAQKPTRPADVDSMKLTLERRVRDGADLRL